MKHVIVTGALGGIGQAVTSRLTNDGYAVTGIDRVSGTAPGPDVIKADLRDPNEVRTAIAAAIAGQGRPWGVVHLAGDNIQAPLADLSDDDWTYLIEVNLSSAFYVVRAAIPPMVEGGEGRVILTSSLFAIRPEANDAGYSAAKAGVIGLARALALEFGPKRISVNCLAPGATLTDRVKAMGQDHLRRQLERIPMGRFGTPAEIAHTVAFLLSDDAALYTGQVFTANGGDWMF